MISVEQEIIIVAVVAVIINAVLTYILSTAGETKAYKRGYNAGLATTEAIALGRLMEKASADAQRSREQP